MLNPFLFSIVVFLAESNRWIKWAIFDSTLLPLITSQRNERLLIIEIQVCWNKHGLCKSALVWLYNCSGMQMQLVNQNFQIMSIQKHLAHLQTIIHHFGSIRFKTATLYFGILNILNLLGSITVIICNSNIRLQLFLRFHFLLYDHVSSTLWSLWCILEKEFPKGQIYLFIRSFFLFV